MRVEDLGLIDYDLALQRQIELVEQLRLGEVPETLLICTHPPVVTVGRATQEGDVFAWDGLTIEVSRGGRATYHGPHQIVIYPILKLEPRGKDIHKYLRGLEQAVIEVLKGYRIEASGREHIDETGVWVGDRKLTSIGVGVRHWITYHGLAMNVETDAEAFRGINPCGMKSDVMISLEEIVGRKVDRDELTRHLINHLTKKFALPVKISETPAHI